MRSIGSGGFGAVYEAERVDAPIRVALKVLHAAVASDDVERKRFRREASVMTELRHEHIAQVVETGETEEGAPFLALELLRGQSLRDEFHSGGPRPADWVAQIAHQVLQALQLAHAQGVVHRDLKPHNIFVCADRPVSPFVKVLDFGIAKLVGAGAQAHTMLTRTGTVLGTPHYMAPEQVYGQDVGPGADLYALGLIMAEALAGRRLMQGESELEILMAQVSPEPIALPLEVTSSPLGWIVERAVNKNAAQRYQSAAAMLADLEAAVAPAMVSPTRPAAPLVAFDRLPAPQGELQARPTADAARRPASSLLVGTLAFLLIVIGAAAAVGWSLWTDDGSGLRGGRGAERWSGSFSALTPSTLSRVLRSRGYTVGDGVTVDAGEGTSRGVTHTVPVTLGDDICSVAVFLYFQGPLADATEEAVQARDALRVAYRREKNFFIVTDCLHGDGKPLLDAVLSARD